MRRAIGAAVSAPKPPASSVTATTYFGVGPGRERDVPGLVGPAAALLGRSGLARDLDREALEHGGRGAARRARGRRAGRRGSPERFSGDVERAARRRLELLLRLAGGVLDPLAQPRPHDLAAVGDRRVRDRHLQRVGLDVALADGEVDVVADRPRPVANRSAQEIWSGGFLRPAALELLVLASRHSASGMKPGRLSGRSMPVGRPSPSLRAQCWSGIPWWFMSRPELVEEHVARHGQRLAQRQHAVATPPAFLKVTSPTSSRRGR